MNIVANVDIFELYLVILGEEFALDLMFRLILLNLIVVNPKFACGGIHHILIIIERHLKLHLLKCRHHKSLSGYTDLVLMRLQYGDIE